MNVTNQHCYATRRSASSSHNNKTTPYTHPNNLNLDVDDLCEFDDLATFLTVDCMLGFRSHKMLQRWKDPDVDRGKVVEILNDFKSSINYDLTSARLAGLLPVLRSWDMGKVSKFKEYLKCFLHIWNPDSGFTVDVCRRYSSDGFLGGKLVATRSWRSCEEIKMLCGAVADLTREEEQRVLREGHNDFSVMIHKSRTRLWLGPAAFLNHDCVSNCTFIEAKGGRRVRIFVKRDIKEGQELFWHYGHHFFGYRNAHCQCGTCERKMRGAFRDKKTFSHSKYSLRETEKRNLLRHFSASNESAENDKRSVLKSLKRSRSKGWTRKRRASHLNRTSTKRLKSEDCHSDVQKSEPEIQKPAVRDESDGKLNLKYSLREKLSLSKNVSKSAHKCCKSKCSAASDSNQDNGYNSMDFNQFSSSLLSRTNSFISCGEEEHPGCCARQCLLPRQRLKRSARLESKRIPQESIQLQNVSIDNIHLQNVTEETRLTGERNGRCTRTAKSAGLLGDVSFGERYMLEQRARSHLRRTAHRKFTGDDYIRFIGLSQANNNHSDASGLGSDLSGDESSSTEKASEHDIELLDSPFFPSHCVSPVITTSSSNSAGETRTFDECDFLTSDDVIESPCDSGVSSCDTVPSLICRDNIHCKKDICCTSDCAKETLLSSPSKGDCPISSLSPMQSKHTLDSVIPKHNSGCETATSSFSLPPLLKRFDNSGKNIVVPSLEEPPQLTSCLLDPCSSGSRERRVLMDNSKFSLKPIAMRSKSDCNIYDVSDSPPNVSYANPLCNSESCPVFLKCSDSSAPLPRIGRLKLSLLSSRSVSTDINFSDAESQGCSSLLRVKPYNIFENVLLDGLKCKFVRKF